MKKLLLISALISFNYFLCQAQWKQTNGPVGGDVASVLSVGPNIFVACTSIDGLFNSVNNGSSWTKVNLSTSVKIYAMDTVGSTIFVGTNAGVYISTNNGTSWTLTNTGFGAGSLTVNAFASSGAAIFAGTNRGVFVSTNGGTSWAATGTMGGAALIINALSVINTQIFAGTASNGIYFSADNGVSWTYRSSGMDATTAKIFALKRNGTKLFAGTDKGVFLSSDSAKTWASAGLATHVINCFAMNGSNLFAAVDNGVYSTVDNGVTWVVKNSGLPANLGPSSMVIRGGNIVAGIKDGWGIYLSSNSGTSWVASNTGLIGQHIIRLAMKDTIIVAGSKSGLFISRNSGNTWSSALSNYILSVAIRGNTIFAGTYAIGTGNGMWRSIDNGVTWSNVGLTGIGIHCIIFNGSNMIYAGTGSGIYLSVDNGTTWSHVNDTGMGAKAIQNIAVIGSTVLAGTSTDGVYVTHNNGISWTNVSTGWVGLSNTALAVTGTTIFAGIAGGTGVYMSKDDGVSWAPFNSGLTSLFITDFAKYGNTLFASSQTGGISVLTSNGWVAANPGLKDLNVFSIAIDGNNILAGTGGSSVWKNNLNSNSISGVVKVKAGAVNSGYAKLYHYKNGAHMASSDSVQINTSGTYTFSNVASGDYVIQANASSTYPLTVPSYCDSTSQWDSAKIISATLGASIIKNIKLVEFPAPTGKGKITGRIVKGAGFNKRTIGDPIPGIDVSVGKKPKPSQTIISHTTTNSNGEYFFKNLSAGNYQVLVDIPGLPRDSYNISITATDTVFTDIDYVADSSKIHIDSTASGIRSFTISDAVIKIYPNPFSKQTLIDLELNDNAPVEIILYNSIGQRISTIENSHLSKGHYQFDLAVSAKGVYLITFNIRGHYSSSRIIEIE